MLLILLFIFSGSKDGNGANLLSNFYSDPTRWAFTFQTFALLSRVKAGPATFGTKEQCVFERSVYSDKHCFAANCYKTGLFNMAEWRVYQEMHGLLMVSTSLNYS